MTPPRSPGAVVIPEVPGGEQLRGAARVSLPPAPGAPHLLLLPGRHQVEDTPGDQAGHLDCPDLVTPRVWSSGKHYNVRLLQRLTGTLN